MRVYGTEPEPTTHIYLPLEEIAPDCLPGMRGGDDPLTALASCLADRRRMHARIVELEAAKAELEAALKTIREEGVEEGLRLAWTRSAEHAQQLAETILQRETAGCPQHLVDACQGPRSKPVPVVVDVHGLQVTVWVKPGIADPHEVWRDLLAKHGRAA